MFQFERGHPVPRPRATPRSVRTAIDKHVAFDRELYALAEEIFATQVAAAGARFPTDLAALRGWIEPSLVGPLAGPQA